MFIFLVRVRLCQKPFLKSIDHDTDPVNVVLFVEDSQVKYLPCGAPSCSETSLLFCNGLFCVWLKYA